MNRIDRENLSVMTESVNTSSPIGLNTATGSPDLCVPASRSAATVADDSTVANSSNVISPKPGIKFALPENFGTVPVNMNEHGDYTGQGLAPVPRPDRSGRSSAQQSQVIEPKPGAKFALPEEDECGAQPAPLSPDLLESGVTPVRVHTDLPGPLPETFRQPSGQWPQPIPPEQPRPAASVPDDMSLPNGGEVLTPKPGIKFAAAQLLR